MRGTLPIFLCSTRLHRTARSMRGKDCCLEEICQLGIGRKYRCRVRLHHNLQWMGGRRRRWTSSCLLGIFLTIRCTIREHRSFLHFACKLFQPSAQRRWDKQRITLYNSPAHRKHRLTADKQLCPVEGGWLDSWRWSRCRTPRCHRHCWQNDR